MGITRLGYYDPLDHRFIKTGWKVRLFRWEFYFGS